MVSMSAPREALESFVGHVHARQRSEFTTALAAKGTTPLSQGELMSFDNGLMLGVSAVIDILSDHLPIDQLFLAILDANQAMARDAS
ncbi:hypothetical protein GTQ99_00415 [Kineococcus sp. T13]|uniref:hypothetical protein n=1 Tax=Kineococcus vitellinus TaxID=2696565 RepID=UPI0014134BA3|nr:hypothetical protein [Kineococcus vitellinus]NAZ73894.1 hypothetical protein [Kineococcus vitellinus]